MNDQAHFRLFDLPGELVEDISFLFNWREAYKLLTVSRAFHALFSRRVWLRLDSKVLSLPEPTRSTAIARYGKLVRNIKLDEGTCSAITRDIDNGVSVYDILSVFSGVTTLKICDYHDQLKSNGIQFKDIMMCFPILYKLVIVIGKDDELYDLVTLAHAINHRRNNSNMNPLECLNLEYFVERIDNPWTRLSNFIQMVMGNCVMNITIPFLSTTTTPPSQSELQVLSKHFMEIPRVAEKYDNAHFCYAIHNRSWFLKTPDLPNSCAYPQSRQLSLRTCCMSSDTYDYCDFKPSNFPFLQAMNITGYDCKNIVLHSYPPAWGKVLLQSWPHLTDLTVSVNMTCEQFVAILEYHRQLTGLEITLQPKMLDENSTFNLAAILPLLPNLQNLCIFGKNGMKIDYNPDYDDSESLIQSRINCIQFLDLSLFSRTLKFLYSLPKLGRINFQHCRFYPTGIGEVTNINDSNSDPNEIDMNHDSGRDNGAGADDGTSGELMATLNTLSAKYSLNNLCGIKNFTLNVRRGDYEWPLDVTVEMIALMPKLQTLRFYGETDDIPKAVKARVPFVNISFN